MADPLNQPTNEELDVTDPNTPSGPRSAPASMGDAPSAGPGRAGTGIDPRGPRFNAAITSIVLAIALITGRWEVLGFQALVFAAGSLLGIQNSPYAYLFRWFVRPRLAPPAELEDPAPPRFAQTVGLAVTGLGLVLAGVGVPAAVEVFSGLALVAAVLNATIGLCLGCELYLRLGLATRFGRATA